MTAIGDMPIAAFDLETTGPNPLSDRIVTAHLSLINPKTKQIQPRDWLLNPGIDIPAGATAVHGITTEHAAEHGAEYAPGVEEIFTALLTAWKAGHVVVAFNGAFDLTLMNAEAERLGIGSLSSWCGPVVDPFVLDKAFDQWRKGSRKLGDVCAHYGVKLDNAHEAKADAMAAARLAWKMLRGFDFTTATVEQIMDCQTRWYAEQQQSFARYLRKLARKITEPDEDGRSVDEQKTDLLARADSITVDWPIRLSLGQRSAA
ncbi:exonuclease domain-containing protein [Rhodococcus sp. NPDC056506]|uniref:exonuclease domain-containing protein n=1 Tax=Rhodococcus sp. NPDC056506 TaxID=3345844 RepID=UPI00366F0A91